MEPEKARRTQMAERMLHKQRPGLARCLFLFGPAIDFQTEACRDEWIKNKEEIGFPRALPYIGMRLVFCISSRLVSMVGHCSEPVCFGASPGTRSQCAQ